jgi:organic radical activating enzyme
MLQIFKIVYLRLVFFIKQRINYQKLIAPFNEDWTKYYWSLQVQWPCNYNCSYCIQSFGIEGGRHKLPKIQPAPVATFLKLNDLKPRLKQRLPRLVIQGGEPLLYRSLPEFIEKIAIFDSISIVSNLSQDFTKVIEAAVMNKTVSVKVIGSFHPEHTDIDSFISRAKILEDAGMIEYCDFVDLTLNNSSHLLKKFAAAGLAVKPYRFTGKKDGRIYPAKATDSCDGKKSIKMSCMTRLVLISPDAKFYNCHAKMYRNSGHLCEIDEFETKFHTGYLTCYEYGRCHPCQHDMVLFKKPV